MNYETVIGIEIHCELKKKTKMFSSAPVAFGEVANTCVNEVDLGHPGTLQCVNKEAVKLAIKAATALKCEIDPLVKFDRKNYYYSDLDVYKRQALSSSCFSFALSTALFTRVSTSSILALSKSILLHHLWYMYMSCFYAFRIA